jgi:hypothetical protein
MTKTKIETTPENHRLNLAVFAFDVITEYAFDRISDLNVLAGYAEARSLHEIEMVLRQAAMRDILALQIGGKP